MPVFWLWNQSIPFIIAGEFKRYGDLLAPIGGLALAGALFVLCAALIQNRAVANIALIGFTMAFFLFTPATQTALIVLGISMLLVIFSIYRIHSEYTLSLGFNISKISRSGLPLYFTVVSLVVSIFYFSHLNEENALTSLFPKTTLTLTLDYLGEPLSSLTGFPLDNPNITVDEILLSALSEQFKSQGISMAQIPEREFSKLLLAGKKDLQDRFGISLNGDEKVTDVLYEALVVNAQKLLGPYQKFLPLASAGVFFFAFKALTLPLYYLTLLTLFILVKFMQWSKIVVSEKRQIEVERLTF